MKKKISLSGAVICFLIAGFLAVCFSAAPVQAATVRQFVNHNGSYYYYDSSGKKIKGWYTSPAGARYYFDPVTGAAKPGLQRVNGKTYYFTERGLMVRSKIVTDHGKRYYVDKNGWRRAGRIRIGRNWYAFDRKTGVQLRNAWFTDTDGSRYYAGNRYSLVQGFYRPDSYYRYFRPSDGKMLTGWQTIDGYRYLFNNRTGVRYDLQKVTLQKNMYCFNRQGRMYRNHWATLGGKTYYAQNNGLLATGWLNLDGNSYYLNRAGERKTGWITSGGKKYYLAPSTGILKKNCWVDAKHYVGNDGAWIPNYKDRDFRWPLNPKNRTITSYFGPRKAPGPGASTYHKGIDIAAKSGEPIYAVADGTISLIRHNNGGAGNHIQITHADGIVSEYMHQSKFAPGLKQGSKVKKGQLIGYVGNTGTSFGAHLHLGIIENGVHKDPLNYVIWPAG